MKRHGRLLMRKREVSAVRYRVSLTNGRNSASPEPLHGSTRVSIRS
jgi:hypothetical protein